jgi:U3 small nucleolar RNA-associated protein 10
VENLLSLALKKVLSASDVEASYGFAPALALLGHSDEGVRTKAVKLITVIGDAVNKEPESEWKALHEISLHVSKNKSSATMGGSSFLSTCMASVIQESKHPTQLQKCILKLCVFAAASCASLKATSLEEAFSKSWLPLGQVSGGYFAAATVMDAAELAGEDAFPLLLRWKNCGKAIFDGLMQSGVAVESVSDSLTILVDSTVRMLKGVTVVDSSALHDSMPKIIISTGPASRGGRARSYSIGKSDGVRFLDPYPKDMQNALTTILSVEKDSTVSRRIIETVFHTILARQSWGEGVFKRIPHTVRQKIVKSVMRIATSNLADNTEEALFALPMEATGVAELFDEEEKATGEVASVTFLADYVNANARGLLESAKVTGLISTMFQLLSSLSSKTVEGSDELDFARQSILTAQVQLIKGIGEADGKTKKVNLSTEHKFGDWMSLLVNLLGGETNESASIRPLVSFRARAAALTLLTTLCSEYPSSAAKFLIPALSASMTNSSSEREARAASESFPAIVAAYCKHMSPSSLSLANLCNAFVDLARKNEDADTRLKFYQSFVDALVHSPGSQSEGYSVVGALAASSLAAEVNATQSQKKSAKSSPVSDLASKILQFTPVATQVAAMMTLVNYAKELMAKLSESDGSPSGVKLLSLDDLELIAFDGPTSDMKKLAKRKPSGKSYSKQQRQTIMKLCTLMMISVSDALATAPFRKFIKNSERDTSGLSLRLWQDLLLVQATCFNKSSGKATGEEDTFWEAAGEATKECLDNLQNSLPSNIFLAFATTLIKEGGTEELRSRAVRLVADRVLTVEASSPEAALFRDMIPFLVRLLDSPGASSMDDGEDYGTLLQQSVLVAVENIARALCLHPGAKPASHSQVFTSAVMKCSGILVKASEPLETSNSTFSDIESASRQLICSAALCAATTVRVCGPRCLPTLPKLMKALVSSLSAANSYLGTDSGSVDEADESRNQARMMQLSILRSLIAVADTLPQFLVPYLNVILAPEALPSSYLRTDRSDQEIAIQAAAARMDAILSSRVPARQLIPATSHAMSAATGTSGIRALLSILKASVQASSGSELAAQRGNLLKAATFAFEYKGSDNNDGNRYSLFAATNELLLALILKLSEVQLRPLYAKLREWRGDLDKANPEALASRRFAFWSLSACLGKELRSIFLPCLGTVFADAVDELELAAAQLCKADAAKKIAGGKKKRRLTEDMNVAYSVESLKPLQPLLLCLEAALRADAHDGGQWIRADDAQRYNLLLDPLGKLLQCQTPATEKSYSFASLVMGADNDTGSVVSALVALAGAAGDESLWKPLNHCVLEACSNEHRSEVRKAGVSCLLSLVKSLGEEYMVLLPECLPVVSELLEDQDEEVAGLAQDCVTLSEELLGESLQDSLR